VIVTSGGGTTARFCGSRSPIPFQDGATAYSSKKRGGEAFTKVQYTQSSGTLIRQDEFDTEIFELDRKPTRGISFLLTFGGSKGGGNETFALHHIETTGN